ncbi:RNA polymerase III subunit [Tieghemostelium lacteum]|uniref:RNA polymerase III subunit n=1 Tax=Tieghemostelium lacteum TaxID=361077 RepID=A0A152A7F1_TIELA|nr:RNA polymerase III subunit [Tieghemostelium lacteum]|eukprot:KYR02148.1 RNA polymerase III subunit [Tieghemostelium lacteum]
MSNQPKDVEMEDIVEENGNGHSKNTTTTTTTTTTSSESRYNFDEMEEDEDDDYVVQEIPVYLTNELADNLILFQYPLRQPWRPYDMSRLEELRIKPKQQRVEMDLSLDTETEYYNSDSTNKVLKTTFSSTSISHRTNYSIGLMKRVGGGQSELHITPLQSIIQLRPNFSQFDEKWQADKASKKSHEEDMEQEESLGQPQQQVYRKPTSKAAAAAAAAAPLNLLKKLEDEEKWIKVTVVDEPELMDEKQFEHFNKLACKDKYEQIPFELDEGQYFEFLCPKAPEDWVPKKSHLKDTVSLEMIHNMNSWQHQLKAILMNGFVMTFSKIMQLLTVPIMEQDVVPELESIAYLIKGRWVIRSEHILKDPDHQVVRDYMLLLFFEKECVTRKEVIDKTRVSSELLRELFVQISDVNAGARAWFLKKQPDEEFMSRYPSVVSKHETYFRTQKQFIERNAADLTNPNRNTVYGMLTKDLVVVNPSPTTSKHSISTSANANNNNSSSAVSGLPNNAPITSIPSAYREGKTTEQQLLFFVYNLFKSKGVCSIQYIKQSIANELESDVENLLTEVTEDMINGLLRKICQTAHHAYFLKTSGNAVTDKYRNVVIDIFKKKMGVNRNDVQNVCKELLGEEAPNALLTQILQELAVAKNKSTWIFKSNFQ